MYMYHTCTHGIVCTVFMADTILYNHSCTAHDIVYVDTKTGGISYIHVITVVSQILYQTFFLRVLCKQPLEGMINSALTIYTQTLEAIKYMKDCYESNI